MLLKADQLKKRFGKEMVLDGLSLKLEKHHFFSILGRSGSGKTTLLKVLAGLEMPEEGKVFLEGKDVTSLAPNRRNIVYLYQEPLLFPHLNIFENIAFGLRLRHVPKGETRQKVEEMLNGLELNGMGGKMPQQLSGGQRQRVAFGRALIINPKLLLLDEPFGALDAETRTNMQRLLKRMAATYAITAVFVTHDLKEAILMGDQLGLMESGRLKIYDSQQAFIDDEVTGVKEELQFWQGLQ